MKKLIRVTTVPISLDKLLGNQLSFMKQYYEVKVISSDPEALKRVAEKYNVTYHSIEMTRKISPIKDLLAVWNMFCFLRKEKPDIIHTHTPKAGIVGMLAAYFAGVSVRMHTVAGLPLMESSGIKRKILMAVEKLTYACATHIYPNSLGLKHFIIQNKLAKKEKLKVIANGSSNGINIEYFKPDKVGENQKLLLKKELGILENDFVFVFIGRLVKDKGINELVKAFSLLMKEEIYDSTKCKLLLVGPFEYELDPLELSTVREIEENNSIISTGYKDDVRPYLAISNVLVFPSYREGFPNVVMQAGAMEMPVLATDINGCNEIIENGCNGILFPPKKIDSLLNCMRQIKNDKVLYDFLKLESRNSIVRRFQQELVWQELLHEYENY